MSESRPPTHVVGLSGGKDSTAMALRLAEVEPQPYVYICTPTGNEPASMMAHPELQKCRVCRL
jgi:tRNA(Ile)-lysidine synthase TilS/MesJ